MKEKFLWIFRIFLWRCQKHRAHMKFRYEWKHKFIWHWRRPESDKKANERHETTSSYWQPNKSKSVRKNKHQQRKRKKNGFFICFHWENFSSAVFLLFLIFNLLICVCCCWCCFDFYVRRRRWCEDEKRVDKERKFVWKYEMKNETQLDFPFSVATFGELQTVPKRCIILLFQKSKLKALRNIVSKSEGNEGMRKNVYMKKMKVFLCRKCCVRVLFAESLERRGISNLWAFTKSSSSYVIRRRRQKFRIFMLYMCTYFMMKPIVRLAKCFFHIFLHVFRVILMLSEQINEWNSLDIRQTIFPEPQEKTHFDLFSFITNIFLLISIF